MITPPPAVVISMLHGKLVAQAICAAAEIGVADALGDAPATAAELATRCASNPDALARLLRALASVGIFEESFEGFVHTPLSLCLKSGVPGSVRDVARMIGADWHMAVETKTVTSVRTGAAQFETVHGVPGLFDHLARDADAKAVFDSAMTSLSRMVNPAIVSSYDFARAHIIVDVGGGRGALLSAIIDAHPHVQGVLFDRDRVEGLPSAITAVTGSFFDAVPAGGDVYLLKHILHDWDDERAKAILEQCYAGMPVGATLLVIEMLVGEANAPSPAKLTDLEMLVVFGGRERTAAEYRALLSGAGFVFRREIPTPAGLTLLEASR